MTCMACMTHDLNLGGGTMMTGFTLSAVSLIGLVVIIALIIIGFHFWDNMD